MRAHVRLRLAVVVAAVIAAFLAAPATAGGIHSGPPPCPDGTSWDNITQTCH